jgi:hypothetical protein
MIRSASRPTRRPAWLVVVTAVVAGAAAAIVPTAPAAAAAACTDSPNDVIVGAPRYNGSRGVVDVREQGRSAQRLTRSSLGKGAGAQGDGFGTAIARTDPVDTPTGPGCSVLAIGAPGVGGEGVVYLTSDSAAGFGATGTTVIAAPKGRAGDRFGETVLISRALADDTNSYELWVGAPRRDVGSAVDAGAVERYSLHLIPETGRFQVEHEQTLRQGAASVPGTTAESNDRFGEVLAGAEYGVIVGVPHENVGSAVDAGMVTWIAPSGDTYRAVRSITQSTRGIPGAAESGDRFGAALTPCAHGIGVPGEDVGRIVDAGLVQELRGCDPAKLLPGRALTQNSGTVPGAAEAGDRFGASLAESFSLEDAPALFIGAPGEDLGAVKDAGSVTGEHACELEDECGWSLWAQGSGLPGAPEAGDAFGSALAVRQLYRVEGTSKLHETTFPLIGVPGEDLGSAKDAGAAATRRTNGKGGVDVIGLGYSGGATAGLRYGGIFATDVYGYPLG